MDSVSVDKLLKQKKDTKIALANMLSFSHKKPLLGIFLDQDLSKDSFDNMIKFLEGVSNLDLKVVILSDNEIKTSSSNVIHLPYSRNNRNTLLNASDMSLVFDFTDIEEMLIHGIIPISPLRTEISDYNPNRETGNAFVYRQNNPWNIFAALVRARETFKFPYDWKNLVSQGVKSVTSR
jgi:hypothetical protein